MSGAPVVSLMYHELELPGRPLVQAEPGYRRYVLTSAEFREQVEYLKASGYRGLNVSESMNFPAGKNVAITFDDGSETDLIAAAPILLQAGFSATFFLTVAWLGKPGYLSASQVCELAAQGFEIGCHSMTHAYLDSIDATDLQHEVGDAKAQLERMLGRPVNHFSCPGGRYDDHVVSAARAAGYLTVSTSRIQANSARTDPFALGRVAILRDLPIAAFASICSGEGLARMRIQGGLRDVAKQLLGNSLYDRMRSVLLGRQDPVRKTT